MAKKKRSEKHIHIHQQQEPVLQKQKKVVSVNELKFPILLLSGILLITLLSYLPVFHAGFVWDDVNYIQKNPGIRSIDLGEIFSGYVMGNYHPFTMLLLAIQYKLFGLNETGYHVINLLLHLLNVFLVFYVILLLSKKNHVAFVAALLFGIHPLHVESVAWASELKDLLYTFFFLGAYIFYLKYLARQERKFYFLALLLFLCSLFSKAMAVSLPVLLLLTDYFRGRKFTMKVWLEKAPFFLLSIIFGVVAILAQQSSESIQDISIYSVPQRIVFASYGFVTYLWKSILPIQLSALYPYPIKSGDNLPALFYVYPLLLAGLLAIIIYSSRFTRKIIFGTGFFAVTVFLVLQLLPVGDAVMADRYSYIPSVGIFYLAGEAFQWLWNKNRKVSSIILLSLFTVFFSVKTYLRSDVWKNGISLWTDVINKYPNAAVGYNNRGGTYVNEKKYDLALTDLTKAIELRPAYAEALNNRGVIFSDQKKYQEALKDLDKAIGLQSKYQEAFSNRGVVLMDMKKYPEALKDFNKAIELRPDYAEGYYNRGVLAMNQNKNDQALVDFNKALELQPNYPEAVINRTFILSNGKNPDVALTEYNNAIKSNPNDPRIYYSRGLQLMNMKRDAEALNDFNKAIQLKPDYAEAYNGRGLISISEKKTEEARKDFDKAIELKPDLAEAYSNRANILRDQDKHEEAIRDYNKAIALNPDFSNAYYNRGVLLIKEKKFEDVIRDFSRVIELKGDSAMCYYNIGMAEYFLNKKDAGCQDLQRASAMGVKEAEAAYKQLCH